MWVKNKHISEKCVVFGYICVLPPLTNLFVHMRVCVCVCAYTYMTSLLTSELVDVSYPWSQISVP